MTATVAPIRPSTNGTRRPVRIEVNQHELVGMCMDLETLATEAITANGYALQTVLGLLPGVIRSEAQRALIDTHERLVRLLDEARLAAGRYDQRHGA